MKKRKLNNYAKELISSEGRARYDTEAIRLIKNKQILAWILHDCVDDFDGMTRKEIMSCINDVRADEVAVEPGLTNTVIVGELTESKITGEGVIRYDVRFSTTLPRLPERRPPRSLYNVELQDHDKDPCDIEIRAVFNGGRMLSEQMGNNISGKDYKNLNKVYSIWICLRTPLKRANTIYKGKLNYQPVVNSFEDDVRYDLLEIICIRLPDENRKKTPKNKPTELMTVLSALFSTKLKAGEKIEILESHGIVLTTEFREEVNSMCNLSEGIYKDGKRAGRKEGRREGRRKGREEGIIKGREEGREEEHKNTLREKQRADNFERLYNEAQRQLAKANLL